MLNKTGEGKEVIMWKQAVRWQVYKSQDNAWVTSDDNEGWNPSAPKALGNIQ